MGLVVTSLNSGSNGNCYYIGNDQEAVLIDCGISCRETEKRMKRLELSMNKVKAVFITHEHSDHIYGIRSLSKKYSIPVYVTDTTMRSGRVSVRNNMSVHFSAYQPIAVGNLVITGFPKFHDAIDPHSFIISGNDVTVGVFTDIGRSCEHLITHFKKCHAAFLESNYDEDMLENGPYPFHLKNRIRNGFGHLSNREALTLFNRHRPPFMSHLFLSHLSKHNNSPALVAQLFGKVAGGTEIIIASRYEETQRYIIRNDFYQVYEPAPDPVKRRPLQAQLTLW